MAPTPAGSPGFPGVWVIASIVVIVLVIASSVVLRRWWIRRQNPALFLEYD